MKQFSICERIVSDAELGTWTCWDIDASERENTEYFTLHSYEEVVALHDILAQYISQHDNTPMNSTDENTATTTIQTILEGYLSEYAPATAADADGIHVVSSQEIILDLADMADISLNDLAASMARLGYSAARRDGKVGWLIKAK